MPATDASPSFGYGLSVSPCSPELTRSVGLASGDAGCVIRLTLAPGDPVEVPRLGTTTRLPLRMDDFKTKFSIRAKSVSHSGAMEMEAVKLALLRLCRNPRLHAHRGVMLVDAQVVGFALRKGRTSAGTLKPTACSIAAVCLAADLKMCYPYLPLESNAADYPSRGKVKMRTKRKRF